MSVSNEVLIFLVSFFGGGGIGGGVGFAMVKAFMHSEAKKAMKSEISDLKDEDAALHKRINHIENDYVQCKYCDMQHINLKTTMDGMDHKLDILIERQMR